MDLTFQFLRNLAPPMIRHIIVLVTEMYFLHNLILVAALVDHLLLHHLLILE